MNSVLDKLNDCQAEAATYVNGPLCVLAGAGSGKTRVLAHRIAYMISEKKIPAGNILAVTFTNKAAGEMRERILRLLGRKTYSHHGTADMPTIGTFHSVCLSILRQNAHCINAPPWRGGVFENNFVVYDETDQAILMKKIMREEKIDEHKTTPQSVLAWISQAKNQLIGPDEYRNYVDSTFGEKVAEIYPLYQRALHQNQAMDFDDLIMKTVELFQKNPDILNYYQEKFKYISADEYQDTNKAQAVLLNLLAKKYKNIAVIGDDDQSIYSWRGATVQNILDFEKEYPDVKVVKLEQNYRSSKLILDAAHGIISKNIHRKDKKLWTQRLGGEKIKLWRALNGMHEADLIASEITRRLHGDGSHGEPSPFYSDFVVLYRTHAQSRIIEEVFLKYGIPYKIVGGIKFYRRKEIKDIIAYLRVIANPADTVSLMRIINVPPRNIGARTIEIIQEFAARNNITMFGAIGDGGRGGGEIQAAKKEALAKFAKLIEKLQKINSEVPASGVIKYLLENSGYRKFIDDNTAEGEAMVENVLELISVAKKYDKLEPGMSLRVFLEEISLIAEADGDSRTMGGQSESPNSVTLMTVHSAKGLEFPYVFIAGLEEGVFPHSRSLIERPELEEERRLMYVACTRAKESLYLLFTQERLLYGEYRANLPSQFLEDIDAALVERNYTPDEDIFSSSGEFEGALRKMFGPPSFMRDKKHFKPVPMEEIESFFRDGDKISHAIFGKGVVVNVIGGIATIAFKDKKIGIKKLAISVAPIKKIRDGSRREPSP
ncbi:UvrD-helicase domain-containing protein [Candidatus Peregrinibacteria bacterium]|nr:UvrD-helicase domain-containing protein [Candidatus Peregrinibacteria bacterium]